VNLDWPLDVLLSLRTLVLINKRHGSLDCVELVPKSVSNDMAWQRGFFFSNVVWGLAVAMLRRIHSSFSHSPIPNLGRRRKAENGP
jgi:hypothetical protein